MSVAESIVHRGRRGEGGARDAPGGSSKRKGDADPARALVDASLIAMGGIGAEMVRGEEDVSAVADAIQGSLPSAPPGSYRVTDAALLEVLLGGSIDGEPVPFAKECLRSPEAARPASVDCAMLRRYVNPDAWPACSAHPNCSNYYAGRETCLLQSPHLPGDEHSLLYRDALAEYKELQSTGQLQDGAHMKTVRFRWYTVVNAKYGTNGRGNRRPLPMCVMFFLQALFGRSSGYQAGARGETYNHEAWLDALQDSNDDCPNGVAGQPSCLGTGIRAIGQEFCAGCLGLVAPDSDSQMASPSRAAKKPKA